MQRLLFGVTLTAMLTATSWLSAQPTPPTPGTQLPTERHSPGTGGVSKPGTPGLPGSKSGPSVREPSGTSGSSTSGASDTTSGPGSANPGPVHTGGAQLQDQAKVPGRPGTKSGSSVKEPGLDATGSPSDSKK
jgi:hypothetical protein